MTGLKILKLQRTPCVRPLKYAVGMNGDSELHFAHQSRTLTEAYGEGDELFESFRALPTDMYSSEFRAAVRGLVEDIDPDVVVCHNTPDTLTCAAILEVGREVPVIHDTHDILSIRPGVKGLEAVTAEEAFANRYSAGNVFVTDGVQQVLFAKYPDLRSRGAQIVFNNFVPAAYVPRDDALLPKLSSSDGRLIDFYRGVRDGFHPVDIPESSIPEKLRGGNG